MSARGMPSGVGLGLRWDFIDEVLEHIDEPNALGDIAFFEIPPENYLGRGGFYSNALERIAARFPLLSHGLTLSIGGLDPFDLNFLNDLSVFLRRFNAPYHSDHLCYSSHSGRMLHDLLPLPLHSTALLHTVDRVKQARDRIGLPLALENITHYLPAGKPAMHEADFITELLERADAKLLLDVNNIYVNSLNHEFDALEFLKRLPLHRVIAIHVAGHERWEEDEVWIDTHGADVCDPVLDLLQFAVEQIGPVPVIIERDHHVPKLDELRVELARVNVAYQRGLEGRRHAKQ